MTKAYLLGALHDGTTRKKTYRISQKYQAYIEFLTKGIHNLGYNAWMYKEGKTRNIWIVEFSKFVLKDTKISTEKEKIEYIRGYFDAEGGIAHDKSVRYYLSFSQKNKDDLEKVRHYLEEIGITCGIIHNPSKYKDPYYWRFFIRAQSYRKFAEIIGSYHPVKRHLLRMKI